jgi:glycosyltransferase involved in cell wall biosynthesis
MSAARPVVATRSGGIRETVVEGQTGFLVDRDDPLPLADKVAELLDQPGLAVSMGERGRRRAVAEFGVERFLSTLLECYMEGSRA